MVLNGWLPGPRGFCLNLSMDSWGTLEEKNGPLGPRPRNHKVLTYYDYLLQIIASVSTTHIRTACCLPIAEYIILPNYTSYGLILLTATTKPTMATMTMDTVSTITATAAAGCATTATTTTTTATTIATTTTTT